MEWTREVYQLPERHGWTATSGYKILVLDRGAVVLEFPADWIVEPGTSETRIRDGASAEESSCVLAVSCRRLRPLTGAGCRSRMCLARDGTTQCLITFDFWPEDAARLGPAWDHVLDSLRLGARLEEPTTGRRIA